MKKISLALAFLLFITMFTACGKDKNIKNESTTGFSESPITSEYTDEQTTLENTTEQLIETTTSIQTTASQTQQQTQVATQQTTEKTKTVTYISENPDNKYICMVANKYGSDKSNLIAFIKTNSSTPGATVLEFSGARDENGNLITTAEELRFVYDVSDSGTIRRASSDGLHNDGYNSIAAKAAMMLGEKYIIPSIDEMRKQRRYEDYF